MLARLRTTIRLLSLQASYTYERLQGIGMAVAQEPLLEPLGRDTEQAKAARARSAQYFNAHPFLAGIAVGALSRAELAGEPGERILRLRTALSGPLGALGDQLFWAGIVPALVGFALVAAALGRGYEALIGVVIGYNVCRLLISEWGVRLGLTHGIAIATELSHSRLREMASAAGALAGLVIGMMVPPVGAWLLQGTGQPVGYVFPLVGFAFLLGILTRRHPLSAPALTLGAGALILVWRWVTA